MDGFVRKALAILQEHEDGWIRGPHDSLATGFLARCNELADGVAANGLEAAKQGVFFLPGDLVEDPVYQVRGGTVMDLAAALDLMYTQEIRERSAMGLHG